MLYFNHSTDHISPLVTMRRRTDQAMVGFTARIAADDRLQFDNLLPMNGGKTWAVQQALEFFCALCEGSEELQRYVHDRVLETRLEEPPRRIEELVPQVPRDLYYRFNRMFGEKGATTWFLRKFVTAFNERASQHPGLEADIQQAVRQILSIPEAPVSA